MRSGIFKAQGSHASCAPRPYKSVQVRTSPYSLARALCPAQSALPANRTHSPVLSKFQSAWHTGCHRPFTVFPVFAVFMVSLLPPCALRNVLCQSSGGSRARQGDSRPLRSGTFAAASRWEYALLFFERYAHGARGETSLFPPCTPLSPRVLYGGLRHAMRLLYG